MKSVVITGADGFVGHHLVRYMVEQGYTVYAIVIPESPTRNRLDDLENVHVVIGGGADYAALTRQLPQNPIAFVHLAWAGVSPEGRNSTAVQMVNIDLTLSAVRLAAAIGAERFVFPGSTTEYTDCGMTINEKACPSPQNAYGAAKVACRYLCAALCEELKLSYIYAVITGIYAADRTDNNVIFYAISTLLKGEKPSFTALEQLWDYVHIDDVIRALFLIAIKGKDKAFYAIGHGDNWPLYNYIYTIRDIIDPTLPLGIGEVPYKDGCLTSSCVDLTRLKEDTGFEPSIPFDEGIREVVRRVSENMIQK